ncbi:MAG: hemerythrin domain-containing protein [Chloroflexota bacterium]|jgi:hemerythrin-like domain-containing protein|nr:hemerythrin domain-containing protein [Chloroflexota bacterium]MDH5242632.1 hemerythrin domain-containing protein [Chloroflexota bacterium]
MTRSSRTFTAERTFADHEHRDLRPGMDRIHEVTRAIGLVAAPDLSIILLDVLDWVDKVVEPHMAWEDGWLYPEMDRRAGTPWATKVMRFEHHQIRRAASRLEGDRERLRHEPDHDQACELTSHLVTLETLVRAHVEREERLLLPLLDEAAMTAARDVTMLDSA